MKKPLPKILQLFLSFLKIGAFTFGGGYAMIALLEDEFVSRKKWLEKTEFLDVLAVAESTPGPIAVNTATYIGYKMAGVLGSFLATLAVCLPSFCIIFAISLVFDKFLEFTLVQYAFRGIQVAVVYLIASAGIKLLKGLKKTPLSVTLFALVFLSFVTLSIFAVRFSTVFYILICGVIGVALYFFGVMRARKKGEEPLSPVSGEEGEAEEIDARQSEAQREEEKASEGDLLDEAQRQAPEEEEGEK